MNPRTMSESGLTPKPPPRGEDLPSEDGEPMETFRHKKQMDLLLDSIEEAFFREGRRDFFAGGNMFLYFSETQSRRNDFRGPDVFVVLDTEWRDRRSWVVWEEDGRTPDVVIEITSDSTRSEDYGRKKDVYARILRVPAYYVFDPFTGRLDGFRLDPTARRYEPILPDARSLLPCAPLGLSLGVSPGTVYEIEAPWLRWFDRDGNVLPISRERLRDQERRADDERRRADDERRRADDERRRADEAERELARLREELARR